MKRTPITLGATLLGALLLVSTQVLAAEEKKEPTGKDLAFDRSKGNCLACHAMPGVADDQQPGNSGPPLIAMKDRYPDKAKLSAKIANPMADNPNTFMPVFSKHKVLNDKELGMVVDFVHGL